MSHVTDPWVSAARALAGDQFMAQLCEAPDESLIIAMRAVNDPNELCGAEWNEWAASLGESEGVALWILANRRWPTPDTDTEKLERGGELNAEGKVAKMLLAHLQAETKRS